MVDNIQWVYHYPHLLPKQILPHVIAISHQHAYSCLLFSWFSYLSFTLQRCLSILFSFEGHPTTAQYKHIWIIILSCLLSSILVNKFSSICLMQHEFVYFFQFCHLSMLWFLFCMIQQPELGVLLFPHFVSPLLLYVLILLPTIMITFCSVELPLSASVTFEYQNKQNAG